MQETVKLQECLSMCLDQMQQGRNTGYWSIHENLLYSVFIDFHKLIMVSRKKRKRTKIFDQMAKFVGSRNSLQCRSHHQKLIEKLGELKLVISAFKKYFGQQYFREQKKRLLGRSSRRAHTLQTQVKQEEDAQYGLLHSQASESGVCSSEESSNGKEKEVRKNIPILVQPCKVEALQQSLPYLYYINNSIIPIPITLPIQPFTSRINNDQI